MNNATKQAANEATAREALGITQASFDLFKKFAMDAGNWGGMPLVGGNFQLSQADKGNLTDLKKHGLLTTWVDEGLAWVQFTDRGAEIGRTLGFMA